MTGISDSLKALEDLGKLVNYFKTRKSTQFKELLEPTFNDLEKVHRNHLDTCRAVIALLKQEGVTKTELKAKLEELRQDSLLMRQKAYALAEAFADPDQEKFSSYWEFGSAVLRYFVTLTGDLKIKQEWLKTEKLRMFTSSVSHLPSQIVFRGLSQLIELIGEEPIENYIIARIEDDIIPLLEMRWRDVLKAYTKLKLDVM